MRSSYEARRPWANNRTGVEAPGILHYAWAMSTPPPAWRRPRAPDLRAWLTVGLFAVSACAQRSDEDSPERVAQELIDRMQRVHGDPQKSKAAFDLLAAEARANLTERATRASAAVGRVVKPEEMLAPSRFYLSFQPRSWSSERGPGWAIVTVVGEEADEQKQIRCLREGDEWKVVVDLPELPPIEHRKPE